MEIMHASVLRPVRFSVLICSLLLLLGSRLSAADLVLQRVPPLTVEQVPSYPQNLARYHFGAQVEAAPRSNPIASLQLSTTSKNHNAAEAALLCDDPTIGYPLPNGNTRLLISPSKIGNRD